ncbi:hypothetical protein MYCTH_2112941 [Thermothelomyces thermophilus ATCC 42464]|uniref:Uncharacterized protein n=1 Tax=Thermothelomyces thermophilus (strain ATCC 42464 / BCRC 31852 / DSM 1799) TaxID=573729 RepID=G2QLW6_THET4|nr:uncharacterized protein MYCTH_2112941 [Thermothelomyces thermophilus ATCC 42464]AEO60946.1 hypothetical protein MYCTH_2112941 [Thermothelomyces thermophilus ATCC 42464]
MVRRNRDTADLLDAPGSELPYEGLYTVHYTELRALLPSSSKGPTAVHHGPIISVTRSRSAFFQRAAVLPMVDMHCFGIRTSSDSRDRGDRQEGSNRTPGASQDSDAAQPLLVRSSMHFFVCQYPKLYLILFRFRCGGMFVESDRTVLREAPRWCIRAAYRCREQAKNLSGPDVGKVPN